MKSTITHHNKNSLAGLTILITRPRQQGLELKQQIEKVGGLGIILPLLDIIPLPIQDESVLRSVEIIIFTSRQAVINSKVIVKQLQNISPSILIFAVGPGTQQELENFGIKAEIPEDECYSSEGLLAIPELGKVDGKNILIVAGEGGRTLLQHQLSERGAKVKKIAVYRRQCPDITSETIQRTITNEQVDVIVSTSSESLNNLLRMLGQKIVLSLPLVVISDRMVAVAQRYGYHGKLIQADNASSAAIINALSQWRERLDNE